MLEKEKQLLTYYSKKLYNKGLTSGTGGNLSIYNKKLSLVAITPSGIDYDLMKEEDIQIIDLNGNKVEGNLKPSSEFKMHLDLYKERPEFESFIHTHSTYACCLAVMNKPLLAVDYLVALSGGKDVRVSEYASFGTSELSKNALKAMENRCAVILANHGLNVAGKDISETFMKTEVLEFCCKLQVKAMSAGNIVVLSDEEMNKMLKDFEHYGQEK